MNSDLTISSIQDKGHKITDIRREVVGIFSKANEPLSAGDVFRELRSKKLNVNKTTVYRELQFLHKEHYLTEVYLRPEETSYESAELIHHHHLVCEICGKVDKVTNCLVSELEVDVLKKKGFKITRHNLEFYGICAGCMKKNQKNGKE
jgi:Fur family ferric uptake transcriptional regulator